MVEFFDQLYFSIQDRRIWFKKIRFYSFERFIVRLLANLLLPLYLNRSIKPLVTSRRDTRIIVSLTTFPARVKKVYLVIEAMLRQTIPPDEILLWLSTEEFESLEELPQRLLRLQAYGLTIKLEHDNLMSHKKYYYAMKEYPDALIITVDDDIYYTNVMIEKLINTYNKFPACIISSMTRRIKFKDEVLQPYSSWPFNAQQDDPSHHYLALGGSGTLFPPGVLDADIFRDDLVKQVCLFADDIWLKNGALKEH